MKSKTHPVSSFVRALRVAFLPVVLLAAAAVTRGQVINETFTSSAANFTTSGGTWSVSSGKYVLTAPVVGGTGLNNRSVHNTSVSGDWILTADASTTATSSVWNDFGVIFGYQNSTNYYFFSSNESNDAGTSGIMKVSGGVVTQLADIATAIAGGTTYAVKIEKTGSTYKVYRNNILLATATDSTWSSGKVGFGTLSDGATFDNLVVTAIGGTVAAPAFSPAGGTYTSAQNVTITTATSGASIRYTTNGTTPTPTTGTLYSSPVAIAATTTLKAIAYKTGMTNSAVTSATYTINSPTPTKPGPTNTGWSGTLTPSGGMTITVAGTTIQNLDITGTVHVKANNVTLRNCRIDGGIYCIQATYGFTGLLIEDCELLNMSSAGIYGGNFTARRVDIHDSDGDAIKPTTNCLVENSWFHHLGKGAGAHADGVQSRSGGTNMTFRWNNFDMPITAPAPYKSNAAFMLEPDGGQLTNVLIENNWMNGGNYTVYGSNMAGVTVRNNQFGRDYRYGIRNGVVNWTGNVWEDNGLPAP